MIGPGLRRFARPLGVAGAVLVGALVPGGAGGARPLDARGDEPADAERPRSAHATLVRSVPADGEILARAPDSLWLRFSEPVEPGLARVDLLGPGPRVRELSLGRERADVRDLTAPLPPLEPAGYRVAWRVVSADGHPVEGDYVFRVAPPGRGAASPPPPPPPSRSGRSAPFLGGAPTAVGLLAVSLVVVVALLLVARRSDSRGATPAAFALAAALLSVLALPLLGWAHAVVYPEVAPPGAYQKYVLRVPNERDLPTTRVELRFPPGVQVVSFAEVAGWRLAVERDGNGRIAAAAWDGELPPGRFVEFPFVAVNPREEGRIAWPAVQRYADGERVEWTGDPDSPTPASVTRIATPGETVPGGVATALSLLALALALVALAVARRGGAAA